MRKRYDWEREYNGSHLRGNLDTPDYKAARAKERAEEYDQIIRNSLDAYQNHVYKLSLQLDDKVSSQWQTAENQDIINHSLAVCSDEEYDAIVEKAAEYLDNLAVNEQEKAHRALKQQIQQAADRHQAGSYKSERNTKHR